MKFLYVALVLLLALRSRVLADGQWTTANLTTCGLRCLSMTVPEAGCSLTDIACQCDSSTLPFLTTDCLLANCSSHDSWVVSKVSASLCNLPHPDRGNDLIICCAVVLALTSAIVFLRLASKCFVDGKMQIEDWLILVAVIATWPMAYFTIAMAKEGFGKHAYDLNDGELAIVFKNFYISENIYSTDLSLSKLSILAFYVRIFPYARVRYASWATIAFVIAGTIARSVSTIVQCQPIAYFWDKDLHGYCVNINALGYAGGALSIVQDLLIVVIPIPVLKQQNMGIKKKISVAFIFILGGGGCIASMIRLRSLVYYGNSIDPTWDYVDVIIWTSIEQAIAMICACLPAIRHLFIRIWPKAFPSSIRSSEEKSSAPPSSGASSRKQSDQPIIGTIRFMNDAANSRSQYAVSTKLSADVFLAEEESFAVPDLQLPLSHV